MTPTRWSKAMAIGLGCSAHRLCRGTPSAALYDGGRVEPEDLRPARWDLMPSNRYMWASVQTVRGCPKHRSFCSVWKTDGQRPGSSARAMGSCVKSSSSGAKGFRFIAPPMTTSIR